MILLSPKEFIRDIAKKVRALRLQLGWSQQELARRAGISFGTYQLFEQTGKITLERLFLISVALGREDDFKNLFAPLPIRAIEELEARPVRKRGRTIKP
ncbi:helix-turn-helix domain-containing protein [Geminisphaera colitermitum]|uniref:helix-turn-helix domain-containing protein n=1 Tax=Geminisphaera colitermitum TaxID=1148786 RepID=UPI000158C4E3|nr:helix-turn-helix transcriptional regulator [Geminisphaera colitermitum]